MLENEGKSTTIQSSQNKLLINEGLISYINSISDLIKDYYKTTTSINKNKNTLINNLENELNSSVSAPNNIPKKLKDIIAAFKEDIISDDKNLTLFFENMKTIFRKMKDRHQQLKNTSLSLNNESMNNMKNETDLQKSKISLIEQQLTAEHILNQKLKNEIVKLKKDHEIEISKLSETNTKLSLNLINKQKEIVNLQKETLDKSSQKEISTSDIKIPKNLSESVNKIIENYKMENEQLKLKQDNFKEKIQEFDNINKNITNKLNILNELYNEVMEEKKHLIEEIASKDIKLVKLQYENEKFKDEIDKLNNIKLSSGVFDDDDNGSDMKDKFIQLSKKLKQEKQEKNEMKEELDKIKEENNKYKNKLLVMGINYIGGEEFKINHDEVIEKLKDEIEQLKERNQTLSEGLESLTSQFWINTNQGDKNK